MIVASIYNGDLQLKGKVDTTNGLKGENYEMLVNVRERANHSPKADLTAFKISQRLLHCLAFNQPDRTP
jgi:hypothetical protein